LDSIVTGIFHSKFQWVEILWLEENWILTIHAWMEHSCDGCFSCLGKVYTSRNWSRDRKYFIII